MRKLRLSVSNLPAKGHIAKGELRFQPELVDYAKMEEGSLPGKDRGSGKKAVTLELPCSFPATCIGR